MGTAGHLSPCGLSSLKRPDWVPHVVVLGFPEGESGNQCL